MISQLHSKSALAAAAGLFLLFGATGCMKTSLSHQALSFNRTVHEHRSQQLLLNILRASNHEPMALTAVTSLSTSNSRKFAVGKIGFPFGPGSKGPYAAEVNGSVLASPNMAVTILDDDKDFVDGFVKPVSIDVIRRYVDQGWDEEFLAYLLVERIETTTAGTLENEPRSSKFETFQEELRDSLGDLDFVSAKAGKPRPQKTITTVKKSPDGDVTETVTIEAGFDGATPEGLRVKGTEATLILRSPEGVLQYLGELTRLELAGRGDRIPRLEDSNEKIFEIASGRRPNHVSVLYRGQNYGVPIGGNAMKSLNFAQHLINLQSKKVAPAPSTLRLLPQ